MKKDIRIKNSKVVGLLMVYFFVSCGMRSNPPGKPDTVPPVIVIKSPSKGDTVKDTINVSFDITDKSRIILTELVVDNKVSKRDTSLNCRVFKFVTDSLVDTFHCLKVKAEDRWDNVGESGVVCIFTKNGNILQRKEKKNERMDGKSEGKLQKSRE